MHLARPHLARVRAAAAGGTLWPAQQRVAPQRLISSLPSTLTSPASRHQHTGIISSSGSKAAATCGGGDSDDDDDASGAPQQQGKPLRVERLLANLGYGKRKECSVMIKQRQLTYAESGKPAKVGEKALPHQLLLNGEALDPAPPLTLLLHKPLGCVVTSPDDERVLDDTVYDLLPYRFGRRRPFLSAVGRLDKDTSGLLIMTDDGQLLHSIQSPVKAVWKRYTATLQAPLKGKEAAKAQARFASGQLLLQGDRTPLLPAALSMLDDTTAEVAICEGRYHQVKRMFAALGHTVVALHRGAIGGLSLAQLQPPLGQGAWRLASAADVAAVLAGPPLAPRAAGAGAGGSESESEGLTAAAAAAGVAQPRGQPQAGARPVAAAAGAAAAGDDTGGDEEGVDDDDDDDDDDDNEALQEAAATSKRYRDSSKWARRRAALSGRVTAMQAQPRSKQRGCQA